MGFLSDWADEEDAIEKNNRIHELESLLSNIANVIEKQESKITGKYRSCYSFDIPTRINELCELIRKTTTKTG